MKLFRQGDVLIRQVAEVPSGTKEVPREAGKVVLAHGEVTGHSHAIASKHARLVIQNPSLRRFLTAKKEVSLLHEEHSEIKLPAGIYEIIIQREFSGEYSREVAD